MKRPQISVFAISLAAAMSASATIYSGSDFSSMASYNGTYVPGSPGYEALAYSGNDDAVVGVVGPLGTLNNLSMSFKFSNPTGAGSAPFAAFGISDNSTWTGDNHRLDVISMNGNQLIGTSLVHVWDFLSNSDVAGFGQLDNVTLNSVLATYGTWEVMRAYADFGAATGSGVVVGSVDINSITITPVPEPTTMTMIAGALLLLPFTLRMLRKNRTA